MLYFTPRVNFPSREFQSVYLAGMTYTVREGNLKLLQAVGNWVKEGLVVVVVPGEAGEVKMTGNGEVG